MERILARLLMAALLSVSPALCRAGVLVQCCERETEESPAVSSHTGCCDEDHAEQNVPQAPSRPDRKCGSCAAVCFGATKPPERLIQSGLTIGAYLPPVIEVDTPSLQRTVSTIDRSGITATLPIPPGDIPLLI